MGRGPTKKYYNNFNENFVQNSLTNLKPEVIKSRITTDFPLILNIEPTNQCNARCYYCPREMMIKEQGISFMSLDTFRKIIDQIGENRLIIMNLHKDGESLLNKELPDMVEYALNKNSAETIH